MLYRPSDVGGLPEAIGKPKTIMIFTRILKLFNDLHLQPAPPILLGTATVFIVKVGDSWRFMPSGDEPSVAEGSH